MLPTFCHSLIYTLPQYPHFLFLLLFFYYLLSVTLLQFLTYLSACLSSMVGDYNNPCSSGCTQIRYQSQEILCRSWWFFWFFYTSSARSRPFHRCSISLLQINYGFQDNLLKMKFSFAKHFFTIFWCLGQEKSPIQRTVHPKVGWRRDFRWDLKCTLGRLLLSW